MGFHLLITRYVINTNESCNQSVQRHIQEKQGYSNQKGVNGWVRVLVIRPDDGRSFLAETCRLMFPEYKVVFADYNINL